MAIFTFIGASIFGAGTFLAAITAAGLQIAAGIGISLLAKSLAGEPESAKFGIQGRLQGGDDIPRSIILGYTATAGSFVYGNVWGNAGGVPNGYLTQVIALADYPIRELVSVEVNSSPVTLLPGSADANLGIPVSEYRQGGVDHLWIKFYDGTQTVADPMLVSIGTADRPYPNTRIGRGIPYIIATSRAPQRKDGETNPLFQEGIPKFKFVLYGAKLYDITKDSTSGGTGTHRRNNPATWGGDGDFFPAVQIYNLLMGIKFNNQWLYGLQNLPAARLPNDNWIAAVNKCRAQIAGPSGNEATYRTGGEIQVGAQIKFAIESLLTGCQGRLTEIGGTYKLFLGEPDSPSMAFSDSDILSTEEQSFTPFFALEDTINGIQAKYPNPNEGWNTKTAPPLIRPDLELLDGNRRLMADVTLDMVPYTGQVQRLMLSALREAQRARRHTYVLAPEFWILEPGDIISWTSKRNGYVNKLFRIDGVSDRPNLDVMVDMTEVDPSDYDWDQDEDFRPVIDGPIQIVNPPSLPMIGWQVYPVSIKDELGRDRKPAIEIWYQSGLEDVQSVKFQVRIFGQLSPFISGEVPYGSPWKTVIQGEFPPAAEYEVRGVFFRTSGGAAEWSDWIYVKTLDIKLIPSVDFDIDGIDFLTDDLKNTIGLLTGTEPGSVFDTISAIEAEIARQAAASLTDQLTMKKKTELLSIQTATSAAAIIQEQEVRASEDEAYAALTLQAIAELETSLGDIINNSLASGLLKFEAIVDETGASASILAKVRASTNNNFSEAAWILKAATTGTTTQSEFGVVANRFFVTDGNIETRPLTFTSGILTFETGRFRKLSSLDGTTIVIDGTTGNFSFGAP